MTPNGCGAATNTVKDVKDSIREAKILRAMKSSSRTHLLGYNLVKLQLTMILIPGDMYPRFLRMILVTGTLDGDQ